MDYLLLYFGNKNTHFISQYNILWFTVIQIKVLTNVLWLNHLKL